MIVLALHHGLTAADELIEKFFGISVSKAQGKKDPNTAKGFDALVLGLLRDLVDAAEPTEQAAIKALSEKLDQNWPVMSKTEQGKAIDAAAKEWFGITRKIPVDQLSVEKARGKTIVQQTKEAVVKKYGFHITPTFDLADEAAIKAAANMQALYTRNSYGLRDVQMSAQARQIVSAGIGEGLDRYEIGKNLEALYKAGGVASFQRSIGYFQMIASVFTARARTYSNLSAFQEAGIATFRFEAVLDEVTTDVCRMMHGKTFSTTQALDGYTKVSESENPEDVKTIQPWVQSGKNDQGDQILYYKNEKGVRVKVADVKESAVGQKDKVGTYSGMNAKALQKAGISAPPVHGFCRSLIVPASSQPSGIAVPKGPKAPTPEVAPAPVAPSIIPAILTPPAPPPPVVAPVIVQPPKPVVAGPAISTLPTELADPKAVVVWDATPKYEGEKLHGVPLKPAEPEFWEKHEDVDVGEPEIVVPSGKHVSAGMIIIEPDGRAWIVEPKGHYGKYEHTFPKGSRDAGESLQKTALREVWEESGLEGNIVGHLGDFEGDTSISRYYIATRKSGAPWTFGKESQAVKLVPIDDLDKFLNKDRDKTIAAKLREKMAADPKMLTRKPLSAAERPRPDKINTSDVILGEQIGPQAGSNVGGLYRGKDGVTRYVKFYTNKEQAFSEHFANALYRDIGQGAPETLIFEHEGKIGIASKIVPGKTFKDLAKEGAYTDADAKGFLDGFVADVLTGNWDAVGYGSDNAYRGNDGRFYRIDNGGALLFRARGNRKPSGVLNKIGEWDDFFSTSVNADYAGLLAKAGVKSHVDMLPQLRAGYHKAEDLLLGHPGGIKAYVDKIAPFMDEEEKELVRSMLGSRIDLLQAQIEKLERENIPRGMKWSDQQFSTSLPKAGLRLEDLPESDVLPGRYGGGSRSSRHLPWGEKRDDYQLRATEAVRPLKSRELSAVKAFTASGSGRIRRSEISGSPDSDSDAILAGMQRCKTETITTWRGIDELSKDTIDRYLHNAGGVFGFGYEDKGASTSTSWNIDVSIDGFMSGPKDHSNSSQYKILYKVNGRSGVPVEMISSLGEGECEILFHRNTKFRITGLSRLKGTNRVLVVECDELIDGNPVGPPAPKTGKAPKVPKAPKAPKIKIPPTMQDALNSGMDVDDWAAQVEAIEEKTGIKFEGQDLNVNHAAWAKKVKAWEKEQKTKKPPLVDWPTPPKAKGSGLPFWDQVTAVEVASGVPYSSSYAKYEDWKKDVAAAKKTAEAAAKKKAKTEAGPTTVRAPKVPKANTIGGLPLPPANPNFAETLDVTAEQHKLVAAIEAKTGIKWTDNYTKWVADVKAWEAAQPKPAKAAEPTTTKPRSKVTLNIPPSYAEAKAEGLEDEWGDMVINVEEQTGISSSGKSHEQWVAELKWWEQVQPPKKIAGVRVPPPPPGAGLVSSTPMHAWNRQVAALEAATGTKLGDPSNYQAWIEQTMAARKLPKPEAPKALPKTIGGMRIPKEPDPKLSAMDPAWHKYEKETSEISAKFGVKGWEYFKTHEEWVAAVKEAAASLAAME